MRHRNQNVLHFLDLCGQRKRLKTIDSIFYVIITPVFWYFAFENLIKYNLICLFTDFPFHRKLRERQNPRMTICPSNGRGMGM